MIAIDDKRAAVFLEAFCSTGLFPYFSTTAHFVGGGANQKLYVAYPGDTVTVAPSGDVVSVMIYEGGQQVGNFNCSGESITMPIPTNASPIRVELEP